MRDEVMLAVKEFLLFEEATSIIYPFLYTWSELPQEVLEDILDYLCGSTDTDDIFCACELYM